MTTPADQKPGRCEVCGETIEAPYANGRPRRYCSLRCAAEAGRLWHVLCNRRHRLNGLEWPGCRLPEDERQATLAEVRRELADLERALGGGAGER